MLSRGSKTVIFAVIVCVVCYTSVRLVSITMELENIRRHGLRYYVETTNDRYIGQIHRPNDHSNLYSSFPKLSNQSIDCRRIFEGDKTSITNAYKSFHKINYSPPTDFEIYKEAMDCPNFLKSHGYNDKVVTKEERSTPIAYSILLYKDAAQVNVLLKAIYRPHNVYCIHVDGASNTSVFTSVKAITECFKNVFLVSKRENIVYAGFSRLQADLNCMKDLLMSNMEWVYFINLPGQQYPLKTNGEIVKILKIYNGANDIEGITGARMLHARFKYKHKYVTDAGKVKIVRTNEENPPPPHNITVVKGSAYGVFSRAFVDFILNDQRAKDVLEWSKSLLSPDEYYWATIHHSKVLDPPGGYTKGSPDRKPWLATYASWAPEPCAKRRLRGVCVFSAGDLSFLASKHELFANKFIMSNDPLALMCLEEWLHNKTVSPLPFATYYYQHLPFIRR